jgi:hypothetical protein
MKKNIDELIEELKLYEKATLEGNNERKPRQNLSHLTDDEKLRYRRAYNRIQTKKNFLKYCDDETGKNTKKREYYKKTKSISLMKCSYRYYKSNNRIEEFKEKKPEIYRKLLEINYITE